MNSSLILMQTALIVIILLLLVIILLLIFFRPKQGNESAVIAAKIDQLQSGFREDFLLNRKESAAISKDNRAELNETIKEFMTGQKASFEELKKAQQQMAAQTIEQLEKINTQVEARLTALQQQHTGSSQLCAIQLIRSSIIFATRSRKTCNPLIPCKKRSLNNWIANRPCS